MPGKLASFIRDHERSTEREKMMEHWLLFHIYEAFFAEHQHPLVYVTEYDRGGFDIAVGCGHHMREFQLKVTAYDATTTKWDIKRSLLRPDIDHLDDFGFLAEGSAPGREGGVILMDVDASDSAIEKVQLYYCDVTSLAFRSLAPGGEQTTAGGRFSTLQKDPFHRGDLELRLSCFLHMSSVRSMLEFAGFPLGEGRRTSIPHLIREAARQRFRPRSQEEGFPKKPDAYPLLEKMINPLLKVID